ncbi:hypothetical protein FE840_007720 [Peteryoungia desertarenae]|uniref:Uncharacterized protein n=1 Tax=Peteryoungia desertarenae TaxID=1813451 RepID=A0ABX6QLJ7_9HYPH|nr:hypothetical protein [Peteryoungia desertarenae]QLF69441.1 hypothetical protein FE840_007720 [Peteryoungia desertarenae]
MKMKSFQHDEPNRKPTQTIDIDILYGMNRLSIGLISLLVEPLKINGVGIRPQ